eukprot:1677048-Rhodomonas_salina.1
MGVRIKGKLWPCIGQMGANGMLLMGRCKMMGRGKRSWERKCTSSSFRYPLSKKVRFCTRTV